MSERKVLRESEESEVKRGRGLRWSVVKGIVFREPHMSVCMSCYFTLFRCVFVFSFDI